MTVLITPPILEEGPIDPTEERYEQLLRNLQGNILKGHGRDHAMLIFFCFIRPQPEGFREKLVKLLECVESAEDQQRKALEFKTSGASGGLFANFFLSATGYEALGFNRQALVGAYGWQPMASMGAGMRRSDHIRLMGDPPLKEWERPYQNQIDAMLLLADDNAGYLRRRVREAIDGIEQFAKIVTVERGEALRNDRGEGLEHFGYVDGLSQPLFFKDEVKSEEPGAAWKQGAPLRLALVRDLVVPDESACGSFLVYRKLDQDVRGFLEREQLLADEMGLTGEDRKRAGAMVIGRFRDGTPLVRHGASSQPKDANDFTYADDANGSNCPVHAHIRKVNHRGEAPNAVGNRLNRIVRRAIPYGVRDGVPAADLEARDWPSDGVGLLFMCFQSNVQKQFNVIQQNWANGRDFRTEGTGIDPLIGQGAETSQQWPRTYGANENRHACSFGRFVKMRGGEIFFAPSIPFLRTLRVPSPLGTT